MGFKNKALLGILNISEIKKYAKKQKKKVSRHKYKADFIEELSPQLDAHDIDELKKIVKLKLSAKRSAYYVFNLFAKNEEIFSLAQNLELYKNYEKKFSHIKESKDKINGVFTYFESTVIMTPEDELREVPRAIHSSFEVNFKDKKILIWTSNTNSVIKFRQALKKLGVGFGPLDKLHTLKDAKKSEVILKLSGVATNFLNEGNQNAR